MNSKSIKNIRISGVITLILIILDQLTKYFAIKGLKGKPPIVLINNVFELHYLENQSAAFGSDFVSFLQNLLRIQYFYDNPDKFLSFKMIMFAIFTIAVIIAMIIIYIKIPNNKHFFYLNLCFILFISGAVGNLIDRIVNHYVVDFFYFSLINFPIFNVADIYVTIAAFLFIILILFYYREDDFEKIFPNKKGNDK